MVSETNQITDILVKHKLSIHEKGCIFYVLSSFLLCLVIVNLSYILFSGGY